MYRFIMIVALCMGAVACGGVSPVGYTVPDDGPMVDVSTDTTHPEDAASTVDASTDTPVVPEDHVTAADAEPELCVPYINDMRREECRGAALCQPNFINPDCSGAMACDCHMTAKEMPPNVCTPSTMPTCMSLVTCSPGRNHCSINLPADVDYVPFAFTEMNSMGQRVPRITLDQPWRRTDSVDGSTGFRGPSLYSARGFVQMCGTLPGDLDGIPSEMVGQGFCAECSGSTCYWNRGALKERAPSIEMSIRDMACTLEVQYFIPGTTAPVRIRTYNSLGRTCS